ncbi:hypothetical protein HWV62_23651 [Athelia sp. TMB]|nr:hypothetical protein HWV62_23651 [Athelia sp. TMB]
MIPLPSIEAVLIPAPLNLVLDPSLIRPVSPQSSISSMRFAPSPFYEPSLVSLSAASEDDEEDSASYWALANLKSPLPSTLRRSTMSSVGSRPLSFSDLACACGVEINRANAAIGSGQEVRNMSQATEQLQEKETGEDDDVGEAASFDDGWGYIPSAPPTPISPHTVSNALGSPRRSKSEVWELEKAHKNAAAIYQYRCVSEDEPIVCHICQTEVEEAGSSWAKKRHYQLRNVQALALHLRLHDLEIE